LLHHLPRVHHIEVLQAEDADRLAGELLRSGHSGLGHPDLIRAGGGIDGNEVGPLGIGHVRDGRLSGTDLGCAADEEGARTGRGGREGDLDLLFLKQSLLDRRVDVGILDALGAKIPVHRQRLDGSRRDRARAQGRSVPGPN
jgi:hypothetical protein